MRWQFQCIRWIFIVFFFQAEDGIRDLVRSRGLGDVYKRQLLLLDPVVRANAGVRIVAGLHPQLERLVSALTGHCLLYTSDAADERSSVDLGGRRIIKKKKSSKLQEVAKLKKERISRAAHTTTRERASAIRV